MEKISRVLLATQYTGDNGAEVLAMCQTITQYSGNSWSVDSSNGATLQLRETNMLGSGAVWPIMLGQWVVVAPDTGIIARMSDGAYHARFRPIDQIVSDAIAANAGVIAASGPMQAAIKGAVGGVKYGGFGVAALPILLPGAQSTPIAVTLQPAQPDVGYEARAFAVSGVAVLTSLSVVSIGKVKDADPATTSSSCVVVVKNNGLASVSGILMVHVTPPMS